MKLTLKLEKDENNKYWAEVEVSEEDLKKQPTDMVHRINLAWTTVRNAYRNG